MKSIRATVPSAVSNRVSRISVSSQIAARGFVTSPAGAISQRPCFVRCRAAPRNRRRNRTPASTASRSIRRGRPVPRFRNRRSAHNLRYLQDTLFHRSASDRRRATARASRLQRGDIDRPMRSRRSAPASRRRQFGCSLTVPGILGWSTTPSRSSSEIASSRDLVRARKFSHRIEIVAVDGVMAQHVVQHRQRMPARVVAFAGIDAERALQSSDRRRSASRHRSRGRGC